MVAAFLIGGLATSFVPLLGVALFLAGAVGTLGMARLQGSPGRQGLVLAVPALAMLAAMEALLLGWQILGLAAAVRGFRISE